MKNAASDYHLFWYTTLLTQFFNIKLHCKKLIICVSKYWPPLPLLSLIFPAATGSRVKGTGHLLKRSKNRSNFGLLHKTGGAGFSGRVPSNEIGDSQREQRLENTAGKVRLPVSMFWQLLQHVTEHGHFAK